MSERIGEKLSSGLKARMDAVKALGSNEIRDLKGVKDELLKVKPVVATVDLVNKTGTNLATFVKTQAEITRRLVGR